jgi:Protein of unknown function (DUF551)
MEWISVKERLPIHNQRVKFKGGFPYEMNGIFEKSENGYEFIHINSKKKVYHMYGVTHWMSSPDLQ